MRCHGNITLTEGLGLVMMKLGFCLINSLSQTFHLIWKDEVFWKDYSDSFVYWTTLHCQNNSVFYIHWSLTLSSVLAALGLSCFIQTPGCNMWDLVSWPGVEPGLPALGVQSLSPWPTGEVPWVYLFMIWFSVDSSAPAPVISLM